MAERLELSTSLYSAEAVRKTLEAFAHLGKLGLEERDDAFVLLISDPDPDLGDDLIHEMANHALALTVTGRSPQQS
jgi:hypothetical protein